ncbi:MAG: hypothetical protein J0L52_09320 [Caulobacterales bacterium]|nr:hypothetical protein [Caulobacterales bacterium]
MRTPVLVFAGLFVATLVLVSCDAPPAAEGAATPTPEDLAATNQRWEGLASDEGTALALLGEGDRQIFHMACLRAERQLQIIASDFTVIGSEERMTMGVDDDAYGFVADTEWTGGGVMARNAIEPQFLGMLARTTDLSVVYGVQRGGPWPAPSIEQRAAFIEGCADIAGASQAEAPA